MARITGCPPPPPPLPELSEFESNVNKQHISIQTRRKDSFIAIIVESLGLYGRQAWKISKQTQEVLEATELIMVLEKNASHLTERKEIDR